MLLLSGCDPGFTSDQGWHISTIGKDSQRQVWAIIVKKGEFQYLQCFPKVERVADHFDKVAITFSNNCTKTNLV